MTCIGFLLTLVSRGLANPRRFASPLWSSSYRNWTVKKLNPMNQQRQKWKPQRPESNRKNWVGAGESSLWWRTWYVTHSSTLQSLWLHHFTQLWLVWSVIVRLSGCLTAVDFSSLWTLYRKHFCKQILTGFSVVGWLAMPLSYMAMKIERWNSLAFKGSWTQQYRMQGYTKLMYCAYRHLIFMAFAGRT